MEVDSNVSAFSVYRNSKPKLKKKPKKSFIKKFEAKSKEVNLSKKQKAKQKTNNKQSIPLNKRIQNSVAKVKGKVDEKLATKTKKLKKKKEAQNKTKTEKPIDNGFSESDYDVHEYEMRKVEAVVNGDGIDVNGKNVQSSKRAKILLSSSSSAPCTSTSVTSPPNNSSSIQVGMRAFRYIIAPTQPGHFLEDFWEKRPCVICRNSADYFSNLISFNAIDEMLRKHHVEYTSNIDITSYKDGVRSTLNPEGRALPAAVWQAYEDGCSVRLLNPQKFIPAIHDLNARLQEFFHSMVGTNVYLTPPNTQGFAPHYDDIEAFVLQIEGEKNWKVYKPKSIAETLPRFSSRNFNQDEIGEPVIEICLRPGDTLYFPRGYIHQASTSAEHHSLHITLSVYQKQSYADLFEILIPKMLSKAIEENVELRQGLPLNIWNNLGLINYDNESREREKILKNCKKLIQYVFNSIQIDEAIDTMAKKFQYDALPPVLTPEEKSATIFGMQTTTNESGEIEWREDLHKETEIRLLRGNIMRLVSEDGQLRLYYYLDNLIGVHEAESNYLEVEYEDAAIIEALIKSYPSYVKVDDLSSMKDKNLDIAEVLWSRGLIMKKI